MKVFLRTGIVLMLAFFCASHLIFDAPRPADAQMPTPAALPPGTDLGLGGLVYQADFNDAAAWPAISGHLKTVFAADGKGGYRADSANILDPIWGPSTAYSGRDYYAELSLDLESCGSQGTIYFLVRMSQPTVVEGNSYAYSISCDGTLEARRIFGGDLRADSSSDRGRALKPGRHHIGVLSIGSTGHWFVDGREVGVFDNILMSQSGHAGFGVSGTIAFDVQQLRIWTLAADALPTGTGKLIYDADFETDPQWPQGLGESALTRTADEVYLLTTLAQSKPFVALSGQANAADVAVQLIFEPRQCEGDSSLGVVFRAAKATAYVFALQCDGHYFAGVLDSRDVPPRLDKTGINHPMKPFAGHHNLAVLAKGSAANLYIDGAQVDSLALQGSAQPGDAGLFAYSASGSMQAGISVFSVWSAK